MSIDFSSGSFYLTDLTGESVLLGNGVLFDMEPEISAKEIAPMLYTLKNSASLSFDVSSINYDMLQSMCEPFVPSSTFTLQYNINVLIQKRWHKKARINKKWLKRYGMKPDTVKVLADGASVTYDKCNGEFEFESENHRYVLRPDQKRKGLKIVWYGDM